MNPFHTGDRVRCLDLGPADLGAKLVKKGKATVVNVEGSGLRLRFDVDAIPTHTKIHHTRVQHIDIVEWLGELA